MVYMCPGSEFPENFLGVFVAALTLSGVNCLPVRMGAASGSAPWNGRRECGVPLENEGGRLLFWFPGYKTRESHT